MPDVSLDNHIFDLEFHPQSDHVYAGLLTGEISGFAYDADDGSCEPTFTLRPTRRSCRGLATDVTGDRLWSVSKDKAIHVIDTKTGSVVDSRLVAHETAINRVAHLLPNTFATGDDNGTIKLWDSRKPAAIQEYKQHFDFISDFLWLEDKRQLVAVSGDATLSVMDVRSNKPEPIAQSEDQEDELSSIASIKGNTKFVVGTQLGNLLIFNRNKGWGDCVDRIPGHPSSIDAMCTLTSDVFLIGSSDGCIRAMEILPTRSRGVIANHGEYPIERIKLDRRDKWLGSASHDEILKLTNVKDALEHSDEEGVERGEEESMDMDQRRDSDMEEAELGDATFPAKRGANVVSKHALSSDADSDAEPPQKKKPRNKGSREPHNKTTGPDRSFFSGL